MYMIKARERAKCKGKIYNIKYNDGMIKVLKIVSKLLLCKMHSQLLPTFNI